MIPPRDLLNHKGTKTQIVITLCPGAFVVKFVTEAVEGATSYEFSYS